MRFIVVSDVHLGHRRTSTDRIIHGLKQCIFNPTTLKDVDAVFIPGDFLDRELTFSSPESKQITEFMGYILKLSIATKTAIRFLDGTPSHDWGQTEHIIRIMEGLELEADVKFYTGLEIVKDPTLDIVIGYVSDEYRENYELAEQEVEEKLKTTGIRPELFFLHGFFDFQVPILKIKTYDPRKWTNWAKAIFIGHDHKFKSWDNITIPGSFDRCSHGEEEPKGYLVVDKVGDEYSVTFVENTYARPYVTLEFTEMSDEDIYNRVEELVKVQRPLDDGTYLTYGRLKLRLAPTHNLGAIINQWRKDYPELGFDIEVKKKKDIELIEKNEKILRENNVVNITADNISDMIIEAADSKTTIPKDLLEREITLMKSEL